MGNVWLNVTLRRCLALLSTASILSGCGTTTPAFHEFYDASDSDHLIASIVEHTNCELREAVLYNMLDQQDLVKAEAAMPLDPSGPKLPASIDLTQYAAQVTLVVTVDEKSNLTPSFAVTPPLESAVTKFKDGATTTTARTASFGAGLNGSVDATRKSTISWLVDFSKGTDAHALALARPVRDTAYAAARSSGGVVTPHCDEHSFIQGDLKLRDWLTTSLLETNVDASRDPYYANTDSFAKQMEGYAKTAKKDAIQNEITFVVLYGGSFNPVWKLLRVSADNASVPLFGTQRTRTEDLLITFGPRTPDGKLAAEAQNNDLAAKIGQAVRNALPNGQ